MAATQINGDRSRHGGGWPKCIGLCLAAATALLPLAAAAQNATCFGKGSMLTCLNQTGGPAFQVNCFGSPQFQTCTAQNGAQLTLSATPASMSNGTIASAYQGTVSGVSGRGATGDPGFGVLPSASTIDPAFATRPTPPTDPLASGRQPTALVTLPAAGTVGNTGTTANSN